jgi:hypothetical protein
MPEPGCVLSLMNLADAGQFLNLREINSLDLA